MNRQKQSFDSCFEVFLADTPESKKIHYQLRYRVYCEEMGFDAQEQFPDRQEIDEWDCVAVHFLVRHRYSGQWLGGMRMVRHKDHVFPFQEKTTVYGRMPSTSCKSSVEISRLCIVKEARRFAFGNARLDAPAENHKISFLRDYGSTNRNIMCGLFRAAAAYSVRQGIKHWYLLSSPAQAHSVRKQGFDMQQIGDAGNHRNPRLPYYLNAKQVLDNPLWLEDYRNDFRLYSEIDNQCSVTMGARQVKQIGVISFVPGM